MKKGLGILAVTFALILSGGDSWGLGLGEIRVKSQFDKGFVALIPLFLTEADTNIMIAVGSKTDYDLIQVARPLFADLFKFEVGDDPDRPGGKAITVTSPDPINATSFNLVVRVSTGSDSMMENYFLAMDFKKSLSIDLPPTQAEGTVPPEQSAPVKTAKAEKKAVKQKSAPAPKASAPKPKEEKPRAETGSVKTAPQWDEKTSPAYAIVNIDADQGKNMVVVRSGVTLFRIARSLNPSKNNIRKIVAAIYLENREKFVNGKIDDFNVGSVLSYNKVNEIAATLSAKDVTEILLSKGKALEKPEKTEKPLPTPQPTATAPTAVKGEVTDAEVIDFLEKWRKDWESNSPGLADYYSDDFKSTDGGAKSAWIDFKKQVVGTNSNITITLENLRIARAGTLIGAHFEQGFKSDRYSSTGRKKVLMRRFPSGLKITGELFVATREADSRNIWAVLVASHGDKDSAAKHIGGITGATAYEAGSFLGAPPYQILAGRFNSKKGAEEFEKKLINSGEKDAKVVRFPFSIRLAVFKDKGTMASFMEQLKKDGYSPYRMGKNSGGKTEYAVYLGAFETRALAENAITALAKSGLSPVIAVP